MFKNYGFEDVVPNLILFNLSEIERQGLIKENMAKKLIRTREVESIKIGNKLHISRHEIIRYLEKGETEKTLNDVIPNLILLNLKDIENYGIIKVDMLKKLIQKNEIQATHIGNKVHVARHLLIQYLEKNTTKRIRSEIMNI